MIEVPAGFGQGLDGALDWIAALPRLATRACAAWELTPDGDLLSGMTAVVLPVRRADGSPAALKLVWQDDETRGEPLALRAWDGDGAVRLLEHDADTGALLLERLHARRSLLDVPIAEAVAVAAGLMRRLALPDATGFRRAEPVDVVAENAAVGSPAPARIAEAATELGRELTANAAHLLVNEDGHYENVLAADREPWLVIDPKPLSCDVEVGAVALLWNRIAEVDGERGVRERLAAVVDAAGMDPELARDWAFYRAASAWPWFHAQGFDVSPGACETITRALSPR
ncbi:aminoglycoside phosphotransferase family protein [Actinosynnema pretiosum]|uniref:Aminoglycoside/hydroxyurea antibiotic resistance kinase n=1 Tax=Actinosynnema pretiosum TaxID=42197 RepID=A0A290Z0M1_9PSEU|nr:aminoglycoside phosphotransferase family protein [Actinosynnema pretiosum]ATE52547.1 aminoglycoside/hydroxyurea antibiotic resistance kinase [Actinosynnema pretiosum]